MTHKVPGEGTKLDSNWWEKFDTNELPAPLDEMPLTWTEDLLEEKNLLVEGPTDALIIHKLIEIFNLTDTPLNGYKINPAGGAPAVADLGLFCKNHGKTALLLFDSDILALNVKNGSSVVDNQLNAKDLNELIALDDFNVISIEDLLPKNLFITELNSLGKTVFEGRWSDITSLRDIPILGIVEAAKKRMISSMNISNTESRRFFFLYKSSIISSVLKNLSITFYTDQRQVEAIRSFFANLKVSLS